MGTRTSSCKTAVLGAAGLREYSTYRLRHEERRIAIEGILRADDDDRAAAFARIAEAERLDLSRDWTVDETHLDDMGVVLLRSSEASEPDVDDELAPIVPPKPPSPVPAVEMH